MAQVGLKNFYYATLNGGSDSVGGTAVYGTLKKVPGLNTADINPTVNKATLYGDDAPMATASSLSEITVRIAAADLPLEDEAVLLGHSMNGSVMTAKADDVAPYVAIAFESEKSDGKIRYIKLLKGKFSETQQTINTRGDNVEYQVPEIEGSFVARISDGAWKKVQDGTSSLGTSWYADV